MGHASEKDIRFYKMIKLFIKSSIAGSTAAVTDLFFLFIFEHFLDWHYMFSVNIAFAIAVLVNFSLQKYWTFEKKEVSVIHIQFMKFISVSGLNLILNASLMYILVTYFGVWYLLGQILVTICLAGMNFLFYRRFIFADEVRFPRHLGAIVIAILIGVSTVGPQLFFIHKAGAEYQGIYMYRSDAELHYLAQMKSERLNNPFLLEAEEFGPVPLYIVAEKVLAFPAKVLGIPISDINLLYKFLFPIGVALLVYFLVFRLIRDRMWSVTTMVVVMLGSNLISLPDLIHLIKWDQAYGQFSLYSRPVNPQFSALFLFGFLHILLSALRTKKWEWFIGAGLLLGTSFYVYLYSATFFLIALIVLSFACRRFLLSVAIGLGLGIAAFRNAFLLFSHPYYDDFAKVGDIIRSHAPILSIGVLAAIALFIVTFKKWQDRTLITGLLLTAIVVVNQQVVTGTLIQDGHYHWYFNVPISIIVLIISLYHLVNRKIGIACIVVLCGASVAVTILIQTSTYTLFYKQALYENKYMVVLDWLKENTEPSSVVLANNTLSALIPVYTNNYVVWEDHASYYLMSPKRREFTTDFVLKNIKERNRYKIDYFVWNKETEPEWKLGQYPFLKEVYKDATFVIYANQADL